MSLINDALRKARLEAARKHSIERDRPLPSYREDSSRRIAGRPLAMAIPLLALGAVAVAVIVTLLLLRSRTTGAPETDQTQQIATGNADLSEPIGNGGSTASASEHQSLPDRAPTSSPPPAATSEAEAAEATEVDGSDSARAAAISEAQRSAPATDVTVDPGGLDDEQADDGTLDSVLSGGRSMSSSSSIDPPESRLPEDASPAVSGQRSATVEPVRSIGEKDVTPDAGRSSAKPAAADSEPARDPLEGAVDESASAPGGGAATNETFLRQADLPGGVTYRLDGIAWSADQPFALVNGQVVGAGGYVDGARVVEVARDRVVLTRDDYRFELLLR